MVAGSQRHTVMFLVNFELLSFTISVYEVEVVQLICVFITHIAFSASYMDILE